MKKLENLVVDIRKDIVFPFQFLEPSLIEPVIHEIVINPRKVEEMFFRPFHRIRHHRTRMQDKSLVA